MSSLSPGRADRRRNARHILRTAARLLAVDPQASITDIAEAAGLARLTVYRHYPGRDALLSALRAAVTDHLTAALDAVDWTAGAGAVRALVRALVELGRDYPTALRRHRTTVDGQPSAIDRRMIDVLAAGQSAGVLRADVDPVLLNDVVFGVLSGTVPPRPDLDPDSLAAALAALLLDGAARR